MKTAEYTIEEMKSLLDSMSAMYDLARIVDPRECRILGIEDDGRLSIRERCYGVWQSDQRCANCSSNAACRTGCHKHKTEEFNDQFFHIQSNPVSLRLQDGARYDAVLELISIRDEEDPQEAANDRAAENVNNMAAQYHANHDSLTKVLNADAFYELARVMIMDEPDRSWTMISGDIRGFHLINDMFGVETGNEVLVETADHLQRLAGRADGLCGRLGGDHFAVLIPEEHYREADLHGIAEVLSAAVNSGTYTVCIQFGVYRLDDPFIPVHIMCNRASTALRTIRSDVRTAVAEYDQKTMQSDITEQRLISGFDKMLGDDQFRMYLQPLTLADGTPFGAEALARCVRDDGSVIPPADFIETLENAGLIHELDVYMLEQAVAQLAAWKGTDRSHLMISVNMSARDFYNIDLVQVLTDLVKKYGVDSSRLGIEITETALVDDMEEVNAILGRLQEAGFSIEIDDFGKGYSSLSMLKDVRADLLKIDREFLRETENESRSRIILNAIIGMAESLDMKVIVEGVETEEQLKTLYAMGCRRFQGYYFSRPLPAREFDRWAGERVQRQPGQ
ncbi:MAG: GGDEF domain-containing protein [Firmicutes bacterium]|nr:GGDEF domain-containing protein [Bacillota bacterium]